jgi:hypothetical protein
MENSSSYGQMHSCNEPFNVSLRPLKYNFEVDIQSVRFASCISIPHTDYTFAVFTICLLSL